VRVVAAPQELKGSLTAREAAEAIAAGVRAADTRAEVDVIPLSDGGPGFVDALLRATGGEQQQVSARDPLGRPITAAFGLLPDGTAVVEMAAAAGLLRLRPEELDPRRASTEGVGDLIRAALDAGARRLLVGIGGSATNDGGSGMARALGVRFLDADGHDLPPGGAALSRLARLDASGLDPRLRAVETVAATDVRNPLCGPEGASAVFGPQKGADTAAVAELDAALRTYAAVIERDLGVVVADEQGAGASGGLGAGLRAFLGAALRPGFPLVAEAVHLEERIARAQLVITGEGRLDGQTGYGKTVAGVSALAGAHGVPAVALCGGLTPGWEELLGKGLTAAFSIASGPQTLAEASTAAVAQLRAGADQVTRLFLAAQPAATGTPARS
jgi:glycerate kinase